MPTSCAQGAVQANSGSIQVDINLFFWSILDTSINGVAIKLMGLLVYLSISLTIDHCVALLRDN